MTPDLLRRRYGHGAFQLRLAAAPHRGPCAPARRGREAGGLLLLGLLAGLALRAVPGRPPEPDALRIALLPAPRPDPEPVIEPAPLPERETTIRPAREPEPAGRVPVDPPEPVPIPRHADPTLAVLPPDPRPTALPEPARRPAPPDATRTPRPASLLPPSVAPVREPAARATRPPAAETRPAARLSPPRPALAPAALRSPEVPATEARSARAPRPEPLRTPPASAPSVRPSAIAPAQRPARTAPRSASATLRTAERTPSARAPSSRTRPPRDALAVPAVPGAPQRPARPALTRPPAPPATPAAPSPRVAREPSPEVRGVPLASLATCRSDREEDAWVQRVIARAGQPRSCRSADGHYHLVETKNRNAFLMLVERAADRAPLDRCGELERALACLERSAEGVHP